MRIQSVPQSLRGAIGYNVYRLSLLFRRRLLRALRAYRLTPEQWQVLSTLIDEEEPVSQPRLCSVTLKDRHSMSRMLKRMEESGWIRRSGDPEHGRIQRVEASRKARSEYPEIRRALLTAFDPVLGALSGEEQREYLGMCARLIQKTEEAK